MTGTASGSRPPGAGAQRPEHPERGIPDGLLVGVLALLLGLTLLVWLATGLSGLFAHGAWPDGVRFTRTPVAMRHLAAQPHDIAAAWPHTPSDQLSGYGLFWGLFVGELMVLVVLAVFVIGTVARWRATRSRARAGAGGAPGPVEAAPASTTPAAAAPAPAQGPSTPGPASPPSGSGPATPGGSPVPYTPLSSTSSAGAPTPAPSATGLGGPNGSGAGAGAATTAAAGPPPGVLGVNGVAAGGGAVATSIPGHPGDGEATPVSGPPTAHSGAPAAGPTVTGAGVNVTGADVTGAAGAAQWTEAAMVGRGTGPVTGVHFTGARSESPRQLAVQAIRAAVGPVVVTTSDPGLWAETKDARAKLGPTLLYDPSHLLDTPARLRWSPSAGCESRDVAAARSVALLAPVRPVHALDSAMADTAETLLRSWLHAAAIDGQPFRQVHRWASGKDAHEPVRILRTHPKAAPGSAGELESALTAYPERREVAQQLTARALSALSSIHIRNACNPTGSDAVALESFIAEVGTLYLMGEAIEDPRTHPGVMPLLTALVSNVVEHGRCMAARSSAGRLDPPLTLVLDDVAAVAPLPQLPELLAEGAMQGLPTLALLRSEEQARARWPHTSLVR